METMERKNKVATVKMERMKGPGAGCAQDARAARRGGQKQLRSAGS